MNDFILKVKCPNDGSECSIVGGDIMESMVLLGDNEQNMQCLACGYASNSNMKTHLQPFPEDFKDVFDTNVSPGPAADSIRDARFTVGPMHV